MNDMHSDAPVVVGVDGSDNAIEAVLWATHEAILRSVELRIVAVAPSVTTPVLFMPVTPDYYEALADGARANCAVATDVASAAAKREHADLAVTREVLGGDLVRELVESSRHAGMLVVGLRGSHHAPLGAIGSIPWALASRSHCPLAVINARAATDEEEAAAAQDRAATVVVGVDSAEHCGPVLDCAFREASIRGGTLRAVHVWDYIEVDYSADPLRELSWTNGMHGESIELTRILAGYREDYPDVPVEQRIVDARPYAGLIEAAGQADLLVVGSRGRGSVASLTMGSTSHRLLHTAPCPLLITM